MHRDFDIQRQSTPVDYSSLKVGGKTIPADVQINTDYNYFAKRGSKNFLEKKRIEKALVEKNDKMLRIVSMHFYEISGIYKRLCRYMSTLFKYDWFITPYRYDESVKEAKVLEGWYKAAKLLENSDLRKTCADIALQVLVEGAYYGYKIEQKEAIYLQELPVPYCRSRFQWNGRPVVEFNVAYFDEAFRDADFRVKVIKAFPKEIQKAYVEYKKGKLKSDTTSASKEGWVVLDVHKAVKFNLGNSDIPMFAAIIPHIIDLADAQELDRQKMEQQLVRVIVQNFPFDKNGDPVLDVQEMGQFHTNAVNMLSDAIGVNVLTTLADVKDVDLSDKGNVSSVDQLEKIERTVYNEAGVSQMQFNTDGNIALEKSIVNDEATMYDLLLQFERYAEDLLDVFNKNPKKLEYKVQFLRTTGYNYKELAQLYKDQTMLGYSKMLPPVALGQSQLSVIMTAILENDILHLVDVFIPPQMSSTMSGKQNNSSGNKNGSTQVAQDSGTQKGRPPKPDSEKAEKTIKNIESSS